MLMPPENAYEILEETLTVRRDGAALSSSFRASVMVSSLGENDSSYLGVSGDVYIVHVSPNALRAFSISPGDEIKRVSTGERLTVQSVKALNGLTSVLCTKKESAAP